MKLNKNELSKLFDVSLLPEDFIIDTTKISTDTRTIKSDNYFFALKGTTFDGNDFIPSAIQNGIRVVFGQKFPSNNPSKTVFLKFEDDKNTLYELAKINLKKSTSVKIAITGSNGKTTTKELLSTLLESKLIMADRYYY